MLSFDKFIKTYKFLEAKTKADPYQGKTLFDMPEEPQDFDPKHPDFTQQLNIANKQNLAIPPHEPPSKENEAKKVRDDLVFDKWDDLWMRQVHEQAPNISPTTMLGLRYWLGTEKDETGNFKYGEIIPEVSIKVATDDGRSTITLKNLHLHRKQLFKKLHDLGFSVESARKKFSHKPPGEAGHKFLQALFKKMLKADSVGSLKWNPKEHSLEGGVSHGKHKQERKAFDPQLWEKHKANIEAQFWDKQFKPFLKKVEQLENKPNSNVGERWGWLRNFKFDDAAIDAIREKSFAKLKDIVGFSDPKFPKGVDDPEFVDHYLRSIFEDVVRHHFRQERSAESPTFSGLSGQEAGPRDKESSSDISVGQQGLKDYISKKREKDASEDDDEDDASSVFVPHARLTPTGYEGEEEETPSKPSKTLAPGYDPIRASKEEDIARKARDQERMSHNLGFNQWLKQRYKKDALRQYKRRVLTPSGKPASALTQKILSKLASKHAKPGFEPGYTENAFTRYLNLRSEVAGATGPFIAKPGKKCGGVDYQCEGAPESMIVPKKKKCSIPTK